MKKLAAHKVRAVAMHGNKSQGQRQRPRRLRARRPRHPRRHRRRLPRIDVDDITAINFDAPEDRDAYVHRTGRTGRAGASGIAASFVLPDQHREMRKIATELGLHKEFDSGPGSSTPLASTPPTGEAARASAATGAASRRATTPTTAARGPTAPAPAATAEAGVAARVPRRRLAARRLHPSGLSEIDLPEADRLGGHLDAFVLAQELEGLFEGEPLGGHEADELVGCRGADVRLMLFPIALTSMSSAREFSPITIPS